MSRRNNGEYYDEPLDDDFDEYDRPRKTSRRRQGNRPRRRGNGGSWLLIGCATVIVMVIAFAVVSSLKMAGNVPIGGIGSIGSTSKPMTYTQRNQQQVPQPSPITLLQVHNVVGNVSIMVDPTATVAMVMTVKQVKAVSQDDANKEFGRIAVQAQAGTTNGSLMVSVSLPNTNSGILNKDTDRVDVTITLPPQVNTNATTTPLTLNVDTAAGNVLLNGLNGVLVVKDGIGDVMVQQAMLADGSHLQTGTGNVVFTGSLDAGRGTKPDPCGNPGGDFHPLYKLQAEAGNVDVTLPTTTNVILDANVNLGKITSEFGISVTNTGSSPSYCGPLLSNSLIQPSAVLVLDVSSGDIVLHKV